MNHLLLTQFAQRSEARSHVLRQELWLFARREVPAFVVLVVVDKLGIRSLCPGPRRWIEFVREDADGNRDRDAFDAEERKLVLPLEGRTGNCGIRQPRERRVVQDIVSCEALRLLVKSTRDHGVVAQYPDGTSAYAMPVRFPSATSNVLRFDPSRLAL